MNREIPGGGWSGRMDVDEVVRHCFFPSKKKRIAAMPVSRWMKEMLQTKNADTEKCDGCPFVGLIIPPA
jgi:hypothetical protein